MRSAVSADELLETVQQLRQLAHDFDAHAYVLEGSFEAYGAPVEEAARTARPLVRSATTALFELLTAIEKRTRTTT